MWQPIETAPKDGTPVIVWGKLGSFPFREREAKFHRCFGWVTLDGKLRLAATHWRPFPSPPESKG